MTAEPPGGDGGFMTVGEVVPGALVGEYRVVDRIGRGGMAVVFRARDERLGRLVALKVLAAVLAEDEEFRHRFIRESRAAAAVDDPHIIPVFEAGEADGVLFIAMRYVAGGDVRSLLRRTGPLPVSRAVSILSPVASALDAAHAAGLVHRDVKPANMLVDTRQGRPDHVYLSDFGLSKAALSSVGLTGSGLLLGTPDYISPEQIAGLPADGRADQYSLACTAFELLTGAPPFSRDHGMAVMYAHEWEPPPLLTSRRPELPPAADGILARAMAKDPAERYPGCQEFAESLRAALGLPAYDTQLATGGSEAADGERIPTVAVQVPTAAAGVSGSPDVVPAADPMLPEADTRSLWSSRQAPGPDGPVEHMYNPATETSIEPAGDLPRSPVGGHGESAKTTAHPHRWRPSRRATVITVACLVIAAVAVPLLTSHSAPPAASPGALQASHSAPPAQTSHPARPVRSTTPRASSPVSVTRHVFTSQSESLGTIGSFNSVAVVPGGGGAWAVGHFLPSQTPMVFHWDGTAWRQTPAPNPGSYSDLNAVAASSATDAWAVGGAMIDHWDGTAWTMAPFQPPQGGFLYGVAALSPTSAWAVGTVPDANDSSLTQCLVEHWDGTAWNQVPCPQFPIGSMLWAVTAVSPTSAWAVGSTGGPGGSAGTTLILHWNGTAWKQAPIPSSPGDTLFAVTAISPANAWAAGGVGGDTVVLHWDGSAWSLVPVPSVGGLFGITAASPASAWAVSQTAVLHWDGTAWKQVGVVNSAYYLQGVTAASSTSAWVVGGKGKPFANGTPVLIMRWNDTAKR